MYLLRIFLPYSPTSLFLHSQFFYNFFILFSALPQFHYCLNNIVLFFYHKTTNKAKNKKNPLINQGETKNEATLLYFQFPPPPNPLPQGEGGMVNPLPQGEGIRGRGMGRVTSVKKKIINKLCVLTCLCYSIRSISLLKRKIILFSNREI